MNKDLRCVVPIYKDEFFREEMNDESRVLGILGNLGFNLDNAGTYYFTTEILKLSSELKNIKLTKTTKKEAVKRVGDLTKEIGIGIHSKDIDQAYYDATLNEKDLSTYLNIFGERLVTTKEEYASRIASEILRVRRQKNNH